MLIRLTLFVSLCGLYTLGVAKPTQDESYGIKMLSFMNQSVQPCDDFYEYACGNWKNVVKPRESYHKLNAILEVNRKMEDNAKMILAKPNINDVAPEYSDEFEKAKKFYKNCLESEIYPMRKSQTYLDVIKNVGGFPAIDEHWNASEFNWFNMTHKLFKYGAEILIKELYTASQYPFPMYLDIPQFGFDIRLRYDTVKATSSIAYTSNWKSMNDILMVYEVPKELRESTIKEIFVFLEATLNLIEEFQGDFRQCNYKYEKLSEEEANAVVDQFSPLYTSECAYFYHHFNRISAEHKAAVANYVSMKFLHYMDPKLKSSESQEDFCVQNVMNSMIYFFDQLYMKIFFNEEVRNDVEEIAINLRQSLKTLFTDADWMDSMPRVWALEKEADLKEYLGKFEDPKMTKRLLGELKNLQFVEGNFEQNMLNLKEFQTKMVHYNSLHHLDLNINTKPTRLMLGMQTTSKYYEDYNVVHIPAGILSPPVYQSTWPTVMKYAALGVLMGHDMIEVYESVGHFYSIRNDLDGWWTNKALRDPSKCFDKYFDNYFVPEIQGNLNSNATKTENIADAGALRMALMAYRRREPNLKEEQKIPGLNLEPEQLFFLGTAQMFCTSYSEADWANLSNDHQINKYRVLGLLTNSEDFAKAYGCPAGSQMNPTENKCRLW
ncbi:neprilysin-2-like [Haematobia irritans]|uniref:neprilysin-2-like n=1 Tax=Haematobia irritans TaxID=7368 RepID=UPI003F4FF1D0